MHAFSGERIQIRRECCDEGLSFARAHLGNISVVEDHAADKLHVEMPLSERTSGSFSYCSKSLRSETVEHSLFFGTALKSFSKTLFKFGSFSFQCLIGEGCKLRFKRIYRSNDRLR